MSLSAGEVFLSMMKVDHGEQESEARRVLAKTCGYLGIFRYL